MTTDHPSDEQLSAHLDGEAPEVGAHVDECAACRAWLADLRAVVAVVATPPPPPDPVVVDAAVAAALSPDVTPAGAPRRLALVAAAAAVLIAVGIATPLVLKGDGQKQTSTALSRKNALDATGADRQSADALTPVDGGDLGDQSDPVALGGIVSSATTPAPAAASQSSGAAAGSTSGGSAASPGPTTIPCTPPAGGGQVVYRARLRWKGTPAEVFAVQPGRRLVIMDRARCQVLVDRNF